MSEKQYEICPECGGYMDPYTAEAAGGPYVDKLEAVLRTLVEAASALTDQGPADVDYIYGQWACCGETPNKENLHAPNCPYVATQKAIEQARAALPQSEQEDTPE